MSNSSKLLHPFFQNQKKKQKAPSLPTPTPNTVVNPLPICQPPLPPPIIEQQQTAPKSKSRGKKATSSPLPQVTKTTALKHVPAVSSCSTPRYVPMVKPKFYSDTLEYKAQMQHEDKYDFSGLIPSQRIKKHNHEFSRLDRTIFGNAHVTQQFSFQEAQEQSYPVRPTTFPMAQHIKDHQHEFFQLQKQKREQEFNSNNTLKKPRKKYPDIQLDTQVELEAFLNQTFPGWHSFSSCAILSQLVFNKSNKRQVNQQQSWNEKYRPKSVNGLLGERYNYIYLKDWLHQMKIEPMSAPATSEKKKTNKKKKVKLHYMDNDFNGLSLLDDGDGDDDDFMPVKKSAKQSKKESIKSNIILLSGHHGIGKTATVYTAADQLGYEVFEINSGSKRSGKDINAMVGEMTKSHHVTFAMPQQNKKSLVDEDKPKKRKLNPCFSPTTLNQSATTGEGGFLKHFLRKKEPPVLKKQPSSSSSEPKQSLILLEEVDLLFEEDKAFWSSIIELSQKSKRPIIMTCNDPDQIPFENLCLQVVLEMKPPSEAELLPYLWLICFSEGYKVDPADLICLMAFLGRDIRQLIQTLELYVKNDEAIFSTYLNMDRNEPLVDMKSKCIPSRVAVDTFRLARSYEEREEFNMEEEDDLDVITKALENNAFIDTWLGWKENGNLIQESVKDQITGFTSLWFEDDEESESKLLLMDLESTASVLNSETMTSTIWNNVISDGASHWNEICDAKSTNFQDYTEAILKLLSIEMMYQPNEQIIMMEYIPYIQQMISANSKEKIVKTRSKRKRLYLPLNDQSIDILTFHRPLIDETEFWMNRLQKLKKEFI